MKQSKTTKVMALMLSLVMITSVFVGNTLSRYVTSVSSTDSARVAIWGINSGEDTIMNLFLEDYIVDGKTVAASNVNGEKIMAPGIKGEAEFSIINFEQDVAPEVAYEVSINLDDSEINDLIKNNPSVQWKLDSGAYGTWEQLKTAILSLSGNETGTHKYGPGEFAIAFQGAQTHKIAWQWIMDNNNNVMDTEMGNLALINDLNAVIKVSIVAQQVDDLVTNEYILDGADQTVNLNDIQPLILRSKSDIENFQSVNVNGNSIDPSNYEKTSGSTVITLYKHYLETLSVGTYIIDIVSSDMIASTRFTVKNGPIVHNGIIPEGGIYYRGIGDIAYLGNYNNDYIEEYLKENNLELVVYESGDDFPEPQTGDIYVYGDYEYRFNMYGYAGGGWIKDSSQNGWGVMALNTNKSEYGKILTTISNKNVTNMNYAFWECENLVIAPIIPESVINMESTFEGCFSLIEAPVIPDGVKYMEGTFIYCNELENAPVIPSSVENMDGIFSFCINLIGKVEINANPISYDYVFFETVKPITLTGSSTLLNEIAATSLHTDSETDEDIPTGNIIVAFYRDGISSILSENSWEVISKVAKSGKAAEYWNVGDKTTVDVNGTDYEVVIADFDHDGDNTITFVFNEDVTTAKMNAASEGYPYGDNIGSWKDSEMRNITMPEILNNMENKDLIKEVEKQTIKGYADGNVNDSIYELITTNDKLFLLSYTEVFGDNENYTWDNFNEGTQYEYFKTAENRIIEPDEYGEGVWWWLRTPGEVNEDCFYFVISGGNGDFDFASVDDSVVPAFVIG